MTWASATPTPLTISPAVPMATPVPLPVTLSESVEVSRFKDEMLVEFPLADAPSSLLIAA